MTPIGVSWGFRTRDELLENGAAVVLDHPLELLELRG
jgi:phosphoglycolate phosphatase